jgi:hypothetical protein
MGLDMYAVRKLNVKQWEHQSADERYTVQIARGDKPVADVQTDRISAIEEEVMYWRKANQIHGWFVNNVQGGKDDCGEYFVSCDQIRDLFSVCKKVIKASNLVEGSVLAYKTWNSKDGTWEEHREPGKVIEDTTIAASLLPTREGCFFGSTDYDEDYLNAVIETRAWAAQMLADCKNGVRGNIYYSSSW